MSFALYRFNYLLYYVDNSIIRFDFVIAIHQRGRYKSLEINFELDLKLFSHVIKAVQSRAKTTQSRGCEVRGYPGAQPDVN